MNIFYGCVKLRAMERKDLPLLMELINDPEIEYMAGGESFPVSEEGQLRWFEHYDGQKELRCMIELSNGTTIGTIGLSNMDYRNRTAEIFYKIDRNIENRIKGDIYDAINGVLTYGFDELNMNCIYAQVLEYNIRSQKVLEKCGFKQDGVLRQRKYKRGAYHDLVVYSILQSEYAGYIKKDNDVIS